VERIVFNANVNMRMIYHYFKNKERLYTEALERAYSEVRAREQDLHIEHYDPKIGLEKLINFTFQHFLDNPELVNLVMGENLLRGQYLVKSDLVPSMSAGLLRSVQELVRNGVKKGVFHKSVDPVQLWVTIFALCWVHLSNKYTLSWMLQTDLSSSGWLKRRRRHIVELIIQYLCRPAGTA
jgi:TetR/AcrR family transcriptional regulator